MAVRTTIRVLPHMANSSRIFSAARRPRLRYTRLSGRSSLRPSQGRYLVRLELVASAVLLGVAALWSAVRGLELAAALRPSPEALAVGAGCGLGLAYVLWAAAVGAGLGGLFALTGSLAAPVAAHGMYNLLALIYLRRRSNPPEERL